MPISAKQRRINARNAGLASAAARSPEFKAEMSRKGNAALWAGHIKKERPYLPPADDLSEHDLTSPDFSATDSDGEWETIEGEK